MYPSLVIKTQTIGSDEPCLDRNTVPVGDLGTATTALEHWRNVGEQIDNLIIELNPEPINLDTLYRWLDDNAALPYGQALRIDLVLLVSPAGAVTEALQIQARIGSNYRVLLAG